jgi:hypothetical protein
LALLPEEAMAAFRQASSPTAEIAYLSRPHWGIRAPG